MLFLAGCAMNTTSSSTTASESSAKKALQKMQFSAEIYPPYIIENNNGKVTGFAADINKKVYQQLNIEPPEPMIMNMDVAYMSVMISDEPVMIGPMVVTQERKQDFYFSEPIGEIQWAIFCDDNYNIDVSDVSSLANYRYSVEENATIIEEVSELGVSEKNIQVYPVAERDQMINDVLSGQFCLLHSVQMVDSMIKNREIPVGRLKKVYDLSTSSVAFAFNKFTPESSVKLYNTTLQKVLTDQDYLKRVRARYGVQ
jgi:ABC-type amino acid transport substrate-binding protein